MNTLKLFTPTVYRTMPIDIFDQFLTNSLNESNSRYPYTNMIEENDQYRIELALPGFTKEQISLNYLKNVLTVKSTLEEKHAEEKNYLTREFVRNNFSKQFVIPRTLDVENIRAEFNNGILMISIPKKEEAKIKEPIEVQIQ